MNKKYSEKLKKTQLEILDEIDRVCKKNDIKYTLFGGTLLGAVRHKGFIPWDDDIDLAMMREDYEKFCHLDQSEFNDKFLLNCFKTNKRYSQSFAKLVMKNTKFIETKNIGALITDYDGIWVDIFPLDDVSGAGLDIQTKNLQRFQRLYTLINIKNNTTYYQNSKLKKIIYKIILFFVPVKFLQNKLEKTITSENGKGYNMLCNYASVKDLTKEMHNRKEFFPLKEIEFEGKKYPCMNNSDAYLKRMYGDYMKLPSKNKRITHNPYYIKFADGEEVYFEK